MKIDFAAVVLAVLLPSLSVATGCGRKPAEVAAGAKPARHEHKAPHGGTAIVLGDELYHVELVRHAATGTLQAYVFDGGLENFIRSSAPSIEIAATVNGGPQTLTLRAVANPATGETVGDTALFETQADWLKTTGEFDAVLKRIAIRGRDFSDVKFNFPKGNDQD
ncbi:MAG TPA: hypothetical protein VM029_18050 [Opitutaceae bacterium]|nr:hypothetical protein [Opitutaceae bacterium]